MWNFKYSAPSLFSVVSLKIILFAFSGKSDLLSTPNWKFDQFTTLWVR